MAQETLEQKTAGRKKASDFPQELINLLDHYVHGRIDRRGFMEGAQKFAVGGVTATALFEMLKPNHAWAVQVPTDDKRIKIESATVPSPKGNGSIAGAIWCIPASADRQAAGGAGGPREPRPQSLHRGRGAAPRGRQLTLAPDGLTSVGGYPGNEEKATQLFMKVDQATRCGRISSLRTELAEGAPGLAPASSASGLLLRRKRHQLAGGAVGLRGSGCRRGSPLWRPADRRKGHRQDQGAAAGGRLRPELDTRITSGWPAFDAELTAAESAARGLSVYPGRQSRLPQRHDAALRRSRRPDFAWRDARLVQQIPG